MEKKIIVSGVGCCLVDLLYNNINFQSEEIQPFLSKSSGDGGLSPGKLVLLEDFERFCNNNLHDFFNVILHGHEANKINIGGPSIVSLIHAAQITQNQNCEIRFYGRAGIDENGEYLQKQLAPLPVKLQDFKLIDNRTPSTIVLSDPNYDNGQGERMFINAIGAAWEMHAKDLDEDFFNSEVVVFGGTAIVPGIHDKLPSLLKKAKENGCLTIINTVYDFINEKKNPNQKWTLGETDYTYAFTDILITDAEEALRLSGCESVEAAFDFFIKTKVESVIITNGSKDIHLFSNGEVFNVKGKFVLPISELIKQELKISKSGDTTGCGDNFAGGLIGSVVNQLSLGISKPDLFEALAWAVVSGGFACFYMGGTYFEEKPMEKQRKIIPYYKAYIKQLANIIQTKEVAR
ncbi:carbohydrate kinase family protein [uncultured Draconibacterium sp.]|uniref:carbohydrate kinase family protein n=1 Tax=uncultured Draconibacterium sp. TaxID=1573823 RepID=UPI0029C6727B|nr:carbohydrate kinase family protein [uncultured Draconibacterium sp.]